MGKVKTLTYETMFCVNRSLLHLRIVPKRFAIRQFLYVQGQIYCMIRSVFEKKKKKNTHPKKYKKYKKKKNYMLVWIHNYLMKRWV